jgi:hypothetical protein
MKKNLTSASKNGKKQLNRIYANSQFFIHIFQSPTNFRYYILDILQSKKKKFETSSNLFFFVKVTMNLRIGFDKP